MHKKIIQDIKKSADKEKAAHLARFFKTGKGQYGEGDLFLGLTVPQTKSIALKYFKEADFPAVQELLENPFHEIRLCGFMILTLKMEKADEQQQKAIFNFYIKNLKKGNNWDLVDLACYKIVGPVLHKKDHKLLHKLAKSDNLWEQRVAMVSTMYFVKRGDCATTFALAETFLNHKHDLMHKAAGWLLREAGKQDINALYAFLDKFYPVMPRTMLRYSLEKVPPQKRAYYMKKP